MMKKITCLVVCSVAIISQSGAQGLSIEASGGLQGTQYALKSGQTKLLPGGSLGVLYTFRLGGQWGLRTGITGGIYRTQATLKDGTAFTDYQVDDQGSAFEYGMKTEGYKETQQFFAAGLPVLLQFQTAGAGTRWYFDGGAKVIYATSVNTQVSVRQLVLTGYYPDYNVTIGNLPQHGFGTNTNWKASGSAGLKPAAALVAGTGASFRISPGARLYAGLYLEYGLTDLRETHDSLPLVSYNPASVSHVKANSVLNMENTGPMKLLSFGLQVRIGFGEAVARSARPKQRPVPQQPQTAPRANPVPQGAVDTTLTYEELDIIQAPVIFGLAGESVLDATQAPHLDEVARILMQHPTLRISIVGHVCNSETGEESDKIGIQRAQAVAKYLRDKGIDRRRMDVAPQSERHAYDPINPAANYRNRRAGITLLN